VITDKNEACIPRTSTALLLLILSVCWNGAVQNMASVVLGEGKLVYFMQWLRFRNERVCGFGRAVILYGLGKVYINLLSCIQLFLSVPLYLSSQFSPLTLFTLFVITCLLFALHLILFVIAHLLIPRFQFMQDILKLSF